MSHDLTIDAQELSDEAFAPYGRIVRTPDEPPGRHGPGWQAWYGYAELDCPQALVFGSVLTEAREISVDVMERHTHTFEWLFPHDRGIIQPVAPPRDLSDPDARPDGAGVRAFRIPVGVAIVMHPGTWHSPAFPAEVTCRYSFATLKPDFAYVPDWIELTDRAVVRVRA